MSQQQNEQKGPTDRSTELHLHLYIAKGAPNSLQAVSNIKIICNDHYNGMCHLEIIDVLEQPERAMTAGILVTPTLVKLTPAPVVQVVGNLSDRDKVILAIGSKDEDYE